MQSGFLGEDGVEVRTCVQSQIGQARTLLCYRETWKPGFSLGTHAFLVFLSHPAGHQEAGHGGGPSCSAVAALPRPGGGEFLPEPALPQPWLPSLLPPLHLDEQRMDCFSATWPGPSPCPRRPALFMTASSETVPRTDWALGGNQGV